VGGKLQSNAFRRIYLKKPKRKVKIKSNYRKKKINYSWIVITMLWTFGLGIGFSYISSILMERVNAIIAFILLLLIIFIGIFFDGLGIAVATADETPFHSMAASKVSGAKESIFLIRNAAAVANFFNDVIGDICGVISGAAGAAIVLKLGHGFSIDTVLLGMIVSGFVAAMTVGGKALGKEISLSSSNYIVYYLGRTIHLVGRGRIFSSKK
jgi:hypothetical protein